MPLLETKSDIGRKKMKSHPIPILALLGFLCVSFFAGLYLDSYFYSKRLMQSQINSVITDVVHYQRGGYQYMYENSYFWASSFNLDTEKEILFAGDSISKSSNSLSLEVYRKQKGPSYLYVATFEGNL